MLGGPLENRDRSHEKMATMMCLRIRELHIEEGFCESIFVICRSDANRNLRTGIKWEEAIILGTIMYASNHLRRYKVSKMRIKNSLLRICRRLSGEGVCVVRSRQQGLWEELPLVVSAPWRTKLEGLRHRGKYVRSYVIFRSGIILFRQSLTPFGL
jgi:hypothetical protein